MVHLLRMVHAESVLHIVFSSLAALHRLFGRIADTGYMACVHRDTGIVAYSPGDVFRLVVTSLPESSRMQRYRYNNLYPVKEIRVLHLHCCLPSQLIADQRLVGIFHPVYQPLDRVVFLVEEESRSAGQMHRFSRCNDVFRLTRQRHLSAVLTDSRLLRARQSRDTILTHRLSPFVLGTLSLGTSHVPPAHRADAGIKEAKE